MLQLWTWKYRQVSCQSEEWCWYCLLGLVASLLTHHDMTRSQCPLRLDTLHDFSILFAPLASYFVESAINRIYWIVFTSNLISSPVFRTASSRSSSSYSFVLKADACYSTISSDVSWNHFNKNTATGIFLLLLFFDINENDQWLMEVCQILMSK